MAARNQVFANISNNKGLLAACKHTYRLTQEERKILKSASLFIFLLFLRKKKQVSTQYGFTFQQINGLKTDILN